MSETEEAQLGAEERMLLEDVEKQIDSEEGERGK